jgi:hypothetical protein
MAPSGATRRPRFWAVLGVAITTAVVAAVAAVGVWYMGLDSLWAIAAVLAVGPVGAFLASLGFEDDAPWDPPRRETPRGVRLVMATMERSLAACDRLARPTVVRRLQSVLFNERDDRLARLTILRRLRALLVTALQVRGLDPTNRHDEDAIVALLGHDALTILQPHDANLVTTAAITRCLDAVEHLGTESARSS